MNTLSKLYFLIGVILTQLFLAGDAYSAQYVLEWGSVSDQRLTGYTLYYGVAPHDYDQSVAVGKVTTYTVTNLDSNVIYYFAVKANYGSLGDSEFSSEITSGPTRYAVGLGANPTNSGKLEILNIHGDYEQDIPVGWAEYNAQSGEARIATGDIDGDGKDEIVLGFAAIPQSGLPAGRFEILDDDFSHLLWGQVSWPDYNALNGETRPAIGDIDGDGREEIFIGLGRGGDGFIEIFRFADGAINSLGWTEINWPDYKQENGESWPALGDLDGDGRAELAIGLGDGGSGIFFVKKGFDPDRLAAGDDPWASEIEGNLHWAEYSGLVGETRPSFGDINGDGNQEIAVGLGKSGGGYVEFFDYLPSSLIYTASGRVDWPDYNATVGETRPIIGDIDGDQRGEIIIGLGKGGGGFLEILEDEQLQFITIDSLQLGTTAYQEANGSLWPSLKKERVASQNPGTSYQLMVIKDGAGSGTIGGGGNYPSGTTVSPVATPAAGSILSGWSPASCGAPFALIANTTCKATFSLVQYTMSVSLGGSGTVTSVPAGISCGTVCSMSYVTGTAVTLTAQPTAGSNFKGWSGACTGTGTCALTMGSNRSVTATFSAIPTYILTVKRSGKGRIVSTPAGISCGTDCTEPYAKGTSVTLKAIPSSGYRFSGWSGACTGTGTCILNMTAAKQVTGTFVK